MNVGLTKEKNFYNFEVVPNPTSSFVEIVSNQAINQPLRIEVMSATGSLVFSKEYSDSNPRINLETIPKGIYFITLQSREKQLIKKLIKN